MSDTDTRNKPAFRPTVLCILDGFGLNPRNEGNAVAQANKPSIDALMQSCPWTTLCTHGERVGLPIGQMGNSEVGHMNIGAGRVVDQWLLRISRALKSSALQNTPAYSQFLSNLKGADGKLHLVGLFSAGGVHSHCEHLDLLLDRLLVDFDGQIVLHLLTDGRDTAPRSALQHIAELEKRISTSTRVQIGSVIGRFFAMDRDKRWERVAKAYNAIMLAQGERFPTAQAAVNAAYEKKISDEFIEPAIIKGAPIGPSDGVLFWNFREDRMREIVAALCLPSFDGFKRANHPFQAKNTLCFTNYDNSFQLPFLFSAIITVNHLGEVLSHKHVRQLRTAETEKYPHVTYFLNAGVEEPYPGEDRELVPSPRDVETYDLKPEMSAAGVTEVVLRALRQRSHDVIVVNFANCDMVGHSGVLSATVRAVETVDLCLGRIIAALQQVRGQALIIADHGNAEQMISYEDGTAYTAHTLYPVPAILFGAPIGTKLRNGGALCDVAPTLLELLNLPQPAEMTGQSLIEHCPT